MAEDPNVTILKELRKRRLFLELIKTTSSCCLAWVRINNNQWKSTKDNFDFFLTSNNREIVLDVHKDSRYATSYRASDENPELIDLYDTIVLIQDEQFDIVAQEEKNLIEVLRWCRCTDTYDEFASGGVVLGGEALVYQPERYFEVMDGGVVVNGAANERQAERFFEVMDGGVVVGGSNELSITADTYIYIWFDNSGSMNSSLEPLKTMRDTLLKDALLPFYNNDSTRYDERVRVLQYPLERTFDVVHRTDYYQPSADPPQDTGNNPATVPYTPPDTDYEYPVDANNVVMLWFQDESSPYANSAGSQAYVDDIAGLRFRLENEFSENFYRCIFFVVDGFPAFGTFMQKVETGSDPAYQPPFGLSDREEFLFKYNITDGGTPAYYLEEVLSGLEDLGFTVR